VCVSAGCALLRHRQLGRRRELHLPVTVVVFIPIVHDVRATRDEVT
jgi:hypothetical protein